MSTRPARWGYAAASDPTHIAGVELDDPQLDPFWARAEQLRLPILVHPHQPAGSPRMGDYYLRNLVGNPVETALAGARLLFGGVLERFPTLAIILSQAAGRCRASRAGWRMATKCAPRRAYIRPRR